MQHRIMQDCIIAPWTPPAARPWRRQPGEGGTWEQLRPGTGGGEGWTVG